MRVSREEIARVLDEIAVLLEIKGENPFKTRAYANGARAIEAFPGDLEAMVREGRLQEIPGIGKALADKVTELATTGRLGFYDRLIAEVPRALVELAAVPGLGPKKARAVYEGLGITTPGELEYAIHENRLVTLPGFGAKTQARIAAGLERMKAGRGRVLLDEADRLVGGLVGQARAAGLTAVAAGEWRRRLEVVGEVPVLVVDADGAALERLPALEAVRARGLRVTVEPVAPGALGAALALATGPDGFVFGLIERARARGLDLTPAGLLEGGEPLPTPDEAALFAALDLVEVPPEWRDAPEALAAAASGQVPRLVEPSDITGVFHVHTTYSDGSASVADMVAAAAARGYTYVGISDHSPAAFYANGVTRERLALQHAEIEAAERAHPGIRVLKGTEADILADGSIDYDAETLARFDFVIASVHSRFQMDRATMTARIVKALAHPRVTILGHPTGRLLLARDPYAVDVDAVLEAAARHGVVVEVNASPHRLDLDWRFLARARALGVVVSVNPDAHAVAEYDYVGYGVGVARKGGLTAADVFNARPREAVLAHLAARRV
ncbi:MAG TPA: helix-hairpin-helix domain-containing protein [Thermodesulfobacteriota bacterium]